MEKITSSAQFADMVREFQKRQAEVKTNCLMLPAEIRELAQAGKLSVQEYEDALCFFIREASCTRLFYYMKPDAALPDMAEWDRPVLLDCVFRGDETAAVEKMGLDRWCAHGFTYFKRNLRMECTKEEFTPPADQEEKNREFPVEPLQERDFDEVIRLWSGDQHLYGATFYTREEFAQACAQGKILGVRLEDGSVGAVFKANPRGRVSFMEHLVVRKGLRGMGMGRTAACAGIGYQFTGNGADKINFWVDEENEYAISLYKRWGCRYDGTVCTEFKLGDIK